MWIEEAPLCYQKQLIMVNPLREMLEDKNAKSSNILLNTNLNMIELGWNVDVFKFSFTDLKLFCMGYAEC